MPKDEYRELRDAIEVAVQQNGRNRAQRRRLRTLIREELAERLEVALEESRRLRKAERPRCGAKTRRGTCCVRPALENGRCPNHGGLSTGPLPRPGASASQRLSGDVGQSGGRITRRDCPPSTRNPAP